MTSLQGAFLVGDAFDELDDEEVPEGADHRFGGPWTLIKLAVLESYLSGYTKALKNQPFKLYYIDAFAGSGHCDIGDGSAVRRIAGSARIAAGIQPPFHQLILIEDSAARAAELASKMQPYGQRARVVRGEANEQLPALCRSIPWTRARAVLFLDPYGCNVAWSTLERIAATAAIDVWYLFPLSGLYRQLAHDASAIDADKRQAITRILGSEDWMQALYAPPPTPDMFDEMPDNRTADVSGITEYVTSRLKSIFPLVLKPRVLRGNDSTGRVGLGAPLFALYFASANPSPKSIGLCRRIAQGVLDARNQAVSAAAV